MGDAAPAIPLSNANAAQWDTAYAGIPGRIGEESSGGPDVNVLS